jgi:uncharacterized Fe-S center protein
MADVLSGDVSLRTGRDDLTVVLLNPDETTALTDLLEHAWKELENDLWNVLDELTNMLLALAKDDAIAKMRFIKRNQDVSTDCDCCDDDD